MRSLLSRTLYTYAEHEIRAESPGLDAASNACALGKTEAGLHFPNEDSG